jgi:hypothetical protein
LANCTTCSSDGSACLTCPSNTYFSNGTCIVCSGNQVNPSNNSNISCSVCSSVCSTCASNGSGLICQSCHANTYLNNGTCIACTGN